MAMVMIMVLMAMVRSWKNYRDDSTRAAYLQNHPSNAFYYHGIILMTSDVMMSDVTMRM